MRDASFLDADEIRAASFVRHVEVHETLASSNDRAAELACDPHVALPALVVARRQTAGRGRGHNSWWSADGALTFSILLETSRFGINARRWPQLSLVVAVAVCDALSIEMDATNRQSGASQTSAGARIGIKWPNDVMLDGRKVCGILIESPGGLTPAKDRLVMGIGINVNNSWRSAPREAGINGIALCDATSIQHDRQEVLINTLNAIRDRIAQLAMNAPQLPASWQRLGWLTKQSVEVESKGNWTKGVCVGIDSDGALVVENAFGTQRIHSGSVRVT
jgi:BirA family biotin operon repressor/biotin-[acetyl-CoA-carboxylase] ligase